MAIPDLASPFWDSRLRLFYRGSLEFPRTRTQKLLKTKDVAVRDRQIGVGPERVQRAPRTKSDEKCYLCAWHKVLPDVPVCSPICVPVQSEFVQGRTSILLAGDSGPPLMDCCTVTIQVWLPQRRDDSIRNEFSRKGGSQAPSSRAYRRLAATSTGWLEQMLSACSHCTCSNWMVV